MHCGTRRRGRGGLPAERPLPGGPPAPPAAALLAPLRSALMVTVKKPLHEHNQTPFIETISDKKLQQFANDKQRQHQALTRSAAARSCPLPLGATRPTPGRSRPGAARALPAVKLCQSPAKYGPLGVLGTP